MAIPPLKSAVPSIVVPFLKVTVPVGVPEPGAGTVTAAVKVTGLPYIDGLDEETTNVLVLAFLTTRHRVLLLLVKLSSPL